MAGPSPAAPDDPRVELILQVYSKDGLIWRVTLYQDRAEALAAAGLA
jgi:hypothetical protein